MSDQELCLLPDSILGLLKTGNTEVAIKVIENGISRIDKGAASASQKKDKNENAD